MGTKLVGITQIYHAVTGPVLVSPASSELTVDVVGVRM